MTRGKYNIDNRYVVVRAPIDQQGPQIGYGPYATRKTANSHAERWNSLAAGRRYYFFVIRMLPAEMGVASWV